MRPSLRFLALAVFGWAAVRAWSLGALPGTELFEAEPSEAKAPPIAATQFPAIEPMQPSAPVVQADYAPPPEAVPQRSSATIRYVQGVVGVPVSMRPGWSPFIGCRQPRAQPNLRRGQTATPT